MILAFLFLFLIILNIMALVLKLMVLAQGLLFCNEEDYMNGRKLVLENGKEFYGRGFGAACDSVAELVWNTSVVGYQEVLSDPSYAGQMVLMTYPVIGSYGINDDDFEAKVPFMRGMIVHSYTSIPSNFRYTKTLSETMEEFNIPGICDIDTRTIASILREEGSQKALITDADTKLEDALKKILEWKLEDRAVKLVSTKKRRYAKTSNPVYNVVIVDCGIQENIIQSLNQRRCNVTVLPFDTTAEEIAKLHADGVLISNGPGVPEDATETIELIKELTGKLPIIGIGLGHQLIALSKGLKTFKMRAGHRGSNRPVELTANGKIIIVNQNHGYAVADEGVEKAGFVITHRDLIDKTIEGMVDEKNMLCGIQYFPGEVPGDENRDDIFEWFINKMKK